MIATHSLNSSLWTWALLLTLVLSFQGPGVSGWNGPRVGLHKGQWQRLVQVNEVREALESRDLFPVDVVVHPVSILNHKAEHGNHVLGYVPHRDEQCAPRTVRAPGVVPLHIGFFGRNV